MLPHGTTAVAADPHEIANVFGVRGVAALAQAAAGLPFTFGICASSCVPASPFESPGAEIHAAQVRELLEQHGAIGVAEVMNYPGVVAGDPGLLAKIAAAGHLRVDGHAPGLGGPALDAYLAAGVESDHECTMLDEAQEKRRKGMWIFIRQGSASKNLADLIPTVLRYGTERIALCSDDREPDTIIRDGHMDDCVRPGCIRRAGSLPKTGRPWPGWFLPCHRLTGCAGPSTWRPGRPRGPSGLSRLPGAWHGSSASSRTR